MTTADREGYIDHLNNPKKDIESRLDGVLAMEICDWIINNFAANVNRANVTCQEELLEITHDEESKANCDSGGYMQLRKNQKIPNLYPNIKNNKFPHNMELLMNLSAF